MVFPSTHLKNYAQVNWVSSSLHFRGENSKIISNHHPENQTKIRIRNLLTRHFFHMPKCSMCGIFTYTYHTSMSNAGKYARLGASGMRIKTPHVLLICLIFFCWVKYFPGTPLKPAIQLPKQMVLSFVFEVDVFCVKSLSLLPGFIFLRFVSPSQILLLPSPSTTRKWEDLYRGFLWNSYHGDC